MEQEKRKHKAEELFEYWYFTEKKEMG